MVGRLLTIALLLGKESSFYATLNNGRITLIAKKLIILLIFPVIGTTTATRFQGLSIYNGLVETALRLLTPTDDSFDENLMQNRAKLEALKEEKRLNYDPDSSSYFDVIPEFQEYLKLDQEFTLRGHCFQDFRAISRKNDDGSVTVTINLHDGGLLCGEAFIVVTNSQYFVKEILFGYAY